jgi:putative tricarboxylic transport membrane protein
MDQFDDDFSRRGFLKGSGAALGVGALSLLPLQMAMAAAFPERNIKVFVPTRAGGGADRNLRTFYGVWKKYISTQFEPSFYPGAAGRVGYETYMGKAPDDCYNLLFGNMGPEVLNWVVKPPTFNLDDFMYFARVDRDPGQIFVGNKSKFKTIDDIVAEGKKRTVNVGVSRLAHPASLGALALARHTGAKFNLIPLSGGRNTRAAVTTGEVDCAALPSGDIVRRAKQFAILAVFDDENPLPKRMSKAVVVNDHFKMKLPPLVAGARAFGIKKSAVDKHPDRFKVLTDTMQKVYTDPDYKKAVLKAKAPWEYIRYGDVAECARYAKAITEIGKEYRELLTGKPKKKKG